MGDAADLGWKLAGVIEVGATGCSLPARANARPVAERIVKAGCRQFHA
jgi:hypothetical protein